MEVWPADSSPNWAAVHDCAVAAARDHLARIEAHARREVEPLLAPDHAGENAPQARPEEFRENPSSTRKPGPGPAKHRRWHPTGPVIEIALCGARKSLGASASASALVELVRVREPAFEYLFETAMLAAFPRVLGERADDDLWRPSPLPQPEAGLG
jgi:hypothetical protein